MESIEEAGGLQLPVIDLLSPEEHVGKQMLEAAIQYGFLYIDTNGTGFTEEIVDREFAISRRFFALPESDKKQCTIGHDNRGWSGMHSEILDPKNQRKGDFKEALNLGEFEGGRPAQSIPKVLKEDVASLYDFEQRCKALCDTILDLLGKGLEIEDPKFFSSRHTSPSGCTVRLLHYPAIPEDVDYRPEVDIRAGAHSDYGSITLLFTRPSQPGLEIRTPSNQWAPVPVFPDGYRTSRTLPPILVNMGDLLEYWTNGLLKSTVHRVIFPADARRGGEDRYSIAYFCHPANNVELVAVPSKIVAGRKMEENGKVGDGGGATGTKAMTASEHLRNRLAVTYGFRMDQTAKETVATS